MTASAHMNYHYGLYTINTLEEMLSTCEAGLRHTKLPPDDIMEIERVANFFTIAGSYQDAFTPAYALLSYIAAVPPAKDATCLSRTAVTVVRNALCLYSRKHIKTLLSMTMHPDTKPGPRNNEYWCLLSSLFGLVLEGSSDSCQRSLKICHAAAECFDRANFSESFDWRYLILIISSYYLCTRRDKQYDVIAGWRTFYLSHRSATAISDLSSYLECLLMWCITALDDNASWKTFNFFSSDLWTDTSGASYTDVSELECKTLFCYFLSSFQHRSRATIQSECHAALLDALNGLQQQFTTKSLAALSTISWILLCSHAEQSLERSRSTLIRQALSRMQRIRNSKPPLAVLEATEWGGSRLSAAFLEALASQYCRPYRISSKEYQRRLDDAVREFADQHFELRFSVDAFVRVPFAGEEDADEEGGCMSLMDLIVDERSL